MDFNEDLRGWLFFSSYLIGYRTGMEFLCCQLSVLIYVKKKIHETFKALFILFS